MYLLPTSHEMQTELCVGSLVGNNGHVDDVGFFLNQPVNISREQIGYGLQLLSIQLQHLNHLHNVNEGRLLLIRVSTVADTKRYTRVQQILLRIYIILCILY